MLQNAEEREEIVDRVAALDIGKSELVCCARVPRPDRAGQRMQEVATYSTMTRSLTELANRLVQLGVNPGGDGGDQRLLLEASVLPVGGGRVRDLAGQRQGRQTPARTTQNRPVGRGVWLCKVAERQMLRPSFVPPKPIRRLRDLTRYRFSLVANVSAEKNRVEKLLEDAGIKLSVVATDIFGVSGRAMMAALIAGNVIPGARADGSGPDARQDPSAGGCIRRPLR